ncbi:MAG: TonB-dependent receptor plug domain-containing protein [Cyclobacteriaceae bacterium]|nr:TonB-dependent receptor plug domain-containing protein [Cyclobacteriaceae bacterium]UYN87886.1 MAG: TonB-dependent receptor plug domain-containing protein [Cyclobacteriaceae bacterium]
MRIFITLLIGCSFASVSAQEIQSNTATIALKSEIKPLFVVNGVPTAYDDLSFVKPNDIESIEVLKNQKAIDRFGEAGKNGAVLITLKNFKKLEIDDKPDNHTSTIKLHSLSTGVQPLFVLDGKIIQQKEVEKINPQSIESIEVLKGEKATNQFGDKGKNGVVVITSKKPPIKIQLEEN